MRFELLAFCNFSKTLFLYSQYSIALLIFFLLELTLAIVCFVFPQKVEEIISSSYLTDNVIKKYREDADLQNLIDFVQQEVITFLCFIT